MNQIKFPITECEGNRLKVVFNSNIYDKEAINATAYKYSGSMFVYQTIDEGNIIAIFETKDGSHITEDVVKQFCTDVVDQQLRVDINNRVGHIRDLLVEEAFKPVNKNR